MDFDIIREMGSPFLEEVIFLYFVLCQMMLVSGSCGGKLLLVEGNRRESESESLQPPKEFKLL